MRLPLENYIWEIVNSIFTISKRSCRFLLVSQINDWVTFSKKSLIRIHEITSKFQLIQEKLWVLVLRSDLFSIIYSCIYIDGDLLFPKCFCFLDSFTTLLKQLKEEQTLFPVVKASVHFPFKNTKKDLLPDPWWKS
jgi:hypothetical protein